LFLNVDCYQAVTRFFMHINFIVKKKNKKRYKRITRQFSLFFCELKRYTKRYTSGTKRYKAVQSGTKRYTDPLIDPL